MMRLYKKVLKLVNNERGSEIIQVALVIALFSLATIGVLTALNADIASYFDAIRAKFMGTVP
jgi:Flp pilus assembly pilin Flp